MSLGAFRHAPKGPFGVRKRKSLTQTKSIESLADLDALEVLDTYTTAFFFSDLLTTGKVFLHSEFKIMHYALQSVFP